MARPRLAILLSELSPLVPADELGAVVGLAVHAEAVGGDAVFLGEHVVMAAGSADAGQPEPFRPLRPQRIPPSTPWLEPLVALGVIAGATSRIALGTALLIAPLRPPVLLAKQASTLAVLSAGRLELGLGVSWQEEEYRALDVPFTERGDRFDDLLTTCKVLWGPSPAMCGSGPDELWMEPKPPHPVPLWFGGAFSNRMVRRVVHHGHGLAPLPRMTAEQFDVLGRAMSAAGRDVAELDVITGIRPVGDDGCPADLEASMRAIPALVDSGYTTFVLWPNVFTDRRDELGDVIASAASAFRGHVGRAGTDL